MTLESLAPTRAYKMNDGALIHARCADKYSLRLGPHNIAAFMIRVATYHVESPTGLPLGPCAFCRKTVRGMGSVSLRGVQIERAA